MPPAGSPAIPRADWLAARALLASRRLRPYVPFGLGAFALVLATAYLVRGPLAERTAPTRRANDHAMATGRDTAGLSRSLQAARVRLGVQDSILRSIQFQAEARMAAPNLAPADLRMRDSLRVLVGQLDAALDRASKAPLTASYRALATARALRSLAGVQALLDTLDLLDRTRQSLDPVAAPQREFAQLSQRANAVGRTLQGIGLSRRAALTRQIAGLEAGGESGRAAIPGADTATVRAARDSAWRDVSQAEALLRDARQWHQAVQARADSTAHARATRILGTTPFIAALAALVIVMVVSFTLVVAAEVRTPTIAHAREVERLTRIPVLATAERFRIPREGRARLQPGSGVDPFRMVYLALTSSGTQERRVCVTGDDLSLTVAVAARLAVSAAADERATLLLDLAPGIPAASAHLGWRDEPGFTEAIAGVRLWREVAGPVGASEGMAIDVVPAGARRQDTDESVRSETMRADFTAFVSDYDFTVLVAPTPASVDLAVIACRNPPTIVVARVARTQIAALSLMLNKLLSSHVHIHGIILIDN